MFVNPAGISVEIKNKKRNSFVLFDIVGFFCEVEVAFFNSELCYFRHFLLLGFNPKALPRRRILLRLQGYRLR